MKTICINIPEEMSEMETKIFFAGTLYEKERLTLGQAAEMAGLTKRTFIEIMGKYGFSIFGDSTEDLIADIENA